MSVPAVIYKGQTAVVGSGGTGDFVDQHEPAPGKSEWGMDTLARTVKGCQSNLAAFIGTLGQGAIYSFGGNDYYLQTWEPDKNAVFPSVSLNYKGLTGGIPPEKASGGQVEQCITLAANDIGIYRTATRDIRYVTRRSCTQYISDGRPTGATYGLDISSAIEIRSSVIRAEDADGNSYVFSGADAPSDLVTALTAATDVFSYMECSPVVGTPYFECTDTATLLIIG